MSSEDTQKQNGKQAPKESTATSTGTANSSPNSRSENTKPNRGSQGLRAGSRFAADSNFVDVPLDDDLEEDADFEKVETGSHSSRVGQRDHTWKYEPGFGQSTNKDIDPDYEMVEKPAHSAHNSHPDHGRKYGNNGKKDDGK